MNPDIKTIAFDADDTLWVNEPYFLETEQQFCGILENYLPAHAVAIPHGYTSGMRKH